MIITELNKDHINGIDNLWNELNLFHQETSLNFKNHFKDFAFKNRAKYLLCKDNMSIFLLQNNNTNIGYCIVTKDNEAGEIDSLYIQHQYQGQGLGNKLMDKAIDWLDKHKCKIVNISVADGNESVIEFYEKYGYKKRCTVLQKA